MNCLHKTWALAALHTERGMFIPASLQGSRHGKLSKTSGLNHGRECTSYNSMIQGTEDRVQRAVHGPSLCHSLGDLSPCLDVDQGRSFPELPESSMRCRL